ncbi:MAG: LacI family transcriptional regulator [Anaerofustis stercorihominis]|nr:LacI family transcriptional regulator [Anaerofustis stercorihominis]
MAKIKDVAREANVSIATVSRVINGVPLVNEDTRARVMAAIEKTGYKPNVLARSLKLQKTNTIGILCSGLNRPVIVDCIIGIQQYLSKEGYQMLLAPSNETDETIDSDALDMLVQRQCDGIVFIGEKLDAEKIMPVKTFSIPAVSAFVPSEDKDIPCVVYDEYEASKYIVRYLKEKGHTKIGAFMATNDFDAVPRRVKGFFDGMKEEDLPLNDKWIFRSTFDYDGGYECAKMLCSLPKAEWPTAIYCFNDDMGLAATKALHKECKKTVPDDISLICMNGSMYAQWNMVALTSLKMDAVTLGNMVAKKLIDLIKTGTYDEFLTYAPLDMQEGESVKDLNK